MIMLVDPTAASEFAPSVFADDHRVCQCIKELKQISEDYGNRKFEQ